MYLGRQWWATETTGGSRRLEVGVEGQRQGLGGQSQGLGCHRQGLGGQRQGLGGQRQGLEVMVASRALEPRGRPRKPEVGLGRGKCAWEARSVHQRPDFDLGGQISACLEDRRPGINF